MTTDEKFKVAALDAYNLVMKQSQLPDADRRVTAFCEAFDAAKRAGAGNQAAVQAADFARDEAR